LSNARQGVNNKKRWPLHKRRTQREAAVRSGKSTQRSGLCASKKKPAKKNSLKKATKESPEANGDVCAKERGGGSRPGKKRKKRKKHEAADTGGGGEKKKWTPNVGGEHSALKKQKSTG